jgi:hypothetical protein
VTAACIDQIWGSTPVERAGPFPCDRHLNGPSHALFRAVDVEAPPEAVFRWLCQLKVAPYSYDWIDNFGRRSPTSLTPGLELLQVGQRVMTMFELVEFERDRHLTMVLKAPIPGTLLGRLAASYVVVPRGKSGSRLIVKLVVQYPTGAVGWSLRFILPWADLVMMRKQLLTLKHLAESCSPPSA